MSTAAGGAGEGRTATSGGGAQISTMASGGECAEPQMVGGVPRAAAAAAFANGLPWAAVPAELRPAALNAHGSAGGLLGGFGILRGGE